MVVWTKSTDAKDWQ